MLRKGPHRIALASQCAVSTNGSPRPKALLEVLLRNLQG
eukprot:SAG31_NODE_32665_length_353_cov_0.598425_1_plen_38_part_01